MNTGSQAIESRHNLLTTIGWRIGDQVTYCLEGSVFIAGAAVQWLRDGLGIIQQSSDVERLAAQVADSDGVYFVPAFVGLGAPYWDAYARGAMFGITRGTTAAHLARAVVESMAFQTRDLLVAMQQDLKGVPELPGIGPILPFDFAHGPELAEGRSPRSKMDLSPSPGQFREPQIGVRLAELKVDGGAAVNNALMQFQADLLDTPVRRPRVAETTALGAAYLAGLAVGYWDSLDDVTRNWSLDREFQPAMRQDERDRRYRGWQKAVGRSLAWAEPE